MRQVLAVLLGVSFFLSGCSQESGPQTISPQFNGAEKIETQPGVYDKTFTSSNGEGLRYTISIPAGFQADNPTPLIVALHYGGQVTPHYARGIVTSLVEPGLGELKAIIVAPDSIAGPWTNEENERAVLELIDHIDAHYNIQSNQTLLTGFSMGGHGTWYIGSRNQERFSAMIVIAGTPAVDKDVVWTTPVYVIHSRADKVVSIDAAEKYVAEQTLKGNQSLLFAPVDDLPHHSTGRFIIPLKAAVPWVKKIWAQE